MTRSGSRRRQGRAIVEEFTGEHAAGPHPRYLRGLSRPDTDTRRWSRKSNVPSAVRLSQQNLRLDSFHIGDLRSQEPGIWPTRS